MIYIAIGALTILYTITVSGNEMSDHLGASVAMIVLPVALYTVFDEVVGEDWAGAACISLSLSMVFIWLLLHSTQRKGMG